MDCISGSDESTAGDTEVHECDSIIRPVRPNDPLLRLSNPNFPTKSRNAVSDGPDELPDQDNHRRGLSTDFFSHVDLYRSLLPRFFPLEYPSPFAVNNVSTASIIPRLHPDL